MQILPVISGLVPWREVRVVVDRPLSCDCIEVERLRLLPEELSGGTDRLSKRKFADCDRRCLLLVARVAVGASLGGVINAPDYCRHIGAEGKQTVIEVVWNGLERLVLGVEIDEV